MKTSERFRLIAAASRLAAESPIWAQVLDGWNGVLKPRDFKILSLDLKRESGMRKYDLSSALWAIKETRRAAALN